MSPPVVMAPMNDFGCREDVSYISMAFTTGGARPPPGLRWSITINCSTELSWIGQVLRVGRLELHHGIRTQQFGLFENPPLPGSRKPLCWPPAASTGEAVCERAGRSLSVSCRKPRFELVNADGQQQKVRQDPQMAAWNMRQIPGGFSKRSLTSSCEGGDPSHSIALRIHRIDPLTSR